MFGSHIVNARVFFSGALTRSSIRSVHLRMNGGFDENSMKIWWSMICLFNLCLSLATCCDDSRLATCACYTIRTKYVLINNMLSHSHATDKNNRGGGGWGGLGTWNLFRGLGFPSGPPQNPASTSPKNVSPGGGTLRYSTTTTNNYCCIHIYYLDVIRIMNYMNSE